MLIRRVFVPAMFVLLCVARIASARITLAVFPLINNDSVASELSEWAAALPAECFGRVARYSSEVQVWDPLFLFKADSTGWQLDSDTATALHQQRWRWDAAVGGSFTTRGDTVAVVLTVVRLDGGVVRRDTVSFEGESCLSLMEQVVDGVLSVAGAGQAASALATRVRGATKSERTYRTFVAGYRFEMFGQHWAAVSAYRRVLEMDPGLTFAAIRIANLHARARDMRNARRWARVAMKQCGAEPVATAMVASFLVLHEKLKVAVSFYSANAGTLSKTGDGLYAEGLLRIAQGSYPLAVASLTRALAYGPADLETDLALGMAYNATGDFQLAVEVFNRLTSYRPDYARYYSFLGSSYRQLGRLMESVRVLRVALTLSGDDVSVLVNLANSYTELGWYQEAERLLSRVIELNPMLTEAVSNLVAVYWQSGRQQKSRETLASLAKHSRRAQSSRNNEAVMSADEGRAKEAYGHLVKAYTSGPKNERVIANLAAVAELLGRSSEALRWYTELLRMNPRHVGAIEAKARIELERGYLEQAEESYRTLIGITPHSEQTVMALAQVLERRRRPREAAEYLEKYLNDFPGDFTVRLRLAGLYADQTWFQVALHHYELVAKEFPDRYDAQIGMARATFGLLETKGRPRNTDSLVSVLRRAQALSSGEAEPDYLLARVFFDYKNDPTVAREHIQRALTADADDALREQVRKTAQRMGAR